MLYVPVLFRRNLKCIPQLNGRTEQKKWNGKSSNSYEKFTFLCAPKILQRYANLQQGRRQTPTAEAGVRTPEKFCNWRKKKIKSKLFLQWRSTLFFSMLRSSSSLNCHYFSSFFYSVTTNPVQATKKNQPEEAHKSLGTARAHSASFLFLLRSSSDK